MTSRNLVRLFLTTSAIGGIVTAIAGFIVRWSEFQGYFANLQIKDILLTFIWLVMMGFLFSVISQMGFFAYLTIHRFGLGIFKSVSLWNAVQVVLIIFALFDLVYLRYTTFAKSGDSIAPYIGLAATLFLVSLITAWFKWKQTNKAAFIPALFFMIVATVVEWSPVLRENERSWLYLMMIALLVCNAYQLLILHKLNTKSEEERQQRSNQSQKQSMKTTKKPSI